MNTSKNALKPRNYLALNPLMQKGGLHESDDVKIARKRARRSCKQNLRKTDWLADLNDDDLDNWDSDFDESQLEVDCL